MADDERSAKWDNLKFVLIFLVVLGHLLYPFRNESESVKGLYFFIYLFHMPLFIFISGLFSKTIIRKKQWRRVFSYLALYLFIRTLDAAGTWMYRGKLKLNFLKTNGPDWYALAIFMFLILTICLKDCRPAVVMTVAILAGLAAGYIDGLGTLFSAMRACVFYPFFLAGYYADRRQLEKWNRPWMGLPAAILLILLAVFFIARGAGYFDFIHILKAKKAYDELNISGFEGLLYRAQQYIAASLIGILVIIAIPAGKNIFSKIGANTLPVFALHYFLIRIFLSASGKSIVLALFPQTYIVFLLACCMFIILLCNSRPFNALTLDSFDIRSRMQQSLIRE